MFAFDATRSSGLSWRGRFGTIAVSDFKGKAAFPLRENQAFGVGSDLLGTAPSGSIVVRRRFFFRAPALPGTCQRPTGSAL